MTMTENTKKKKVNDNSGGAVTKGLHAVKNHNEQRDNLSSNFVGFTGYLALNYDPPLGLFSEYVAFCTICFI